MSRVIALMVSTVVFVAACSQQPHPTSPTVGDSGPRSMSAGAGGGPSNTASTASPATAVALDAAVLRFQPGTAAHASATPRTEFALDGRSAPSRGEITAATGNLAGPPSLATPVVNQEHRTVAIAWSPGSGGAPLIWKLFYTTPTGLSGHFDIPAGQTSFGGTLPFDGTYTVRICAFNGGSVDQGCMWSATETFHLVPRVPGAPVGVTGSGVGSRLTLSWGMPAPNTGGPPTTFVVLWNGNEYVVGLVTSVFADGVPAGRYLLVVFARNAAGNGPPVTIEVTVSGDTAVGTYHTSFSGTMTATRTFPEATCEWQTTYTGTATVLLTQSPDGLTATLRIAGTNSEPGGTTSSPNFECLPGERLFDSTSPAIISGTDIARSGIDLGHSTGTFSGNLGATSIVSTLHVTYDNGTGAVTIPMVLMRQP